jgi:hypothetical protein
VNQEEASYVAKRLAIEVAEQVATASADPATDEVAADIVNVTNPHEVPDAHVNALVLAAIKHLTAA